MNEALEQLHKTTIIRNEHFTFELDISHYPTALYHADVLTDHLMHRRQGGFDPDLIVAEQSMIRCERSK